MPVADDYQPVLEALNNPSSTAIYSEAPGAGFSATDSFSDRSVTLTDEQLDALRCGTASGNTARGLRAWAQAFGNSAHQGSSDGLQGYDMQTLGGAAGFDTANRYANAIVGMSVSYAHTNSNARDPIMTDTTIHSYQGTLYGDYDLGDHAFLRGFLSYARSNNDTTRSAGGIHNGSYGANEFTTLVKAGKSFKHESFTFTPSVLGRWVHYNPEDYSESGFGGLHVSQQTLDIVEVGPSADITWKVKTQDGSWAVPSVHAGYRYDLSAEQITTFYTGCCGTTTGTSAKPAQNRFNVGGSLTWYSTSTWDVKAGYDMDYRRDFLAHTGILRGTFRY
jgi:outer membrane autotransporter protein